MTDRTCAACGATYRPYRHTQRYCTPLCRPGRPAAPGTPRARPPGRSARGDGMSSPASDGAETADELEFIRAVDRFRKRVPFPSLTDYLRILRELGWRKGG